VGAQLGTGAGEDASRAGRAASVKIAPRMAAAVPMDPYVVRVLFVDGEVRDVDVEPMLDGPVFGPLRDPELFRAVTVDSETRTITWPGGADLDPDVIYDPSLRPD